MHRIRRNAVAGLLLAPLALVLDLSVAAAHQGSGAGVRIPQVVARGVVTGVTSDNLRIQTASGNVTAPWTSSTRVIRMVIGTSVDLAVSAHVTLHLVTGTSTVNAVQIDMTMPRQSKPPSPHPTPSGTYPPHRVGTPKPDTATHHHPHGPMNQIEGQVLKVSGGAITVRTRQGQTATYTLLRNATITKWMPGKFGDLAIGLEVRVVIVAGKTASITILNG
jgi:hypothetical protein